MTGPPTEKYETHAILQTSKEASQAKAGCKDKKHRHQKNYFHQGIYQAVLPDSRLRVFNGRVEAVFPSQTTRKKKDEDEDENDFVLMLF
jgi:hypothetical protein